MRGIYLKFFKDRMSSDARYFKNTYHSTMQPEESSTFFYNIFIFTSSYIHIILGALRAKKNDGSLFYNTI